MRTGNSIRSPHTTRRGAPDHRIGRFAAKRLPELGHVRTRAVDAMLQRECGSTSARTRDASGRLWPQKTWAMPKEALLRPEAADLLPVRRQRRPCRSGTLVVDAGDVHARCLGVPDLLFHRGTRLLICRGILEDLQIAFAQLNGTPVAGQVVRNRIVSNPIAAGRLKKFWQGWTVRSMCARLKPALSWASRAAPAKVNSSLYILHIAERFRRSPEPDLITI